VITLPGQVPECHTESHPVGDLPDDPVDWMDVDRTAIRAVSWPAGFETTSLNKIDFVSARQFACRLLPEYP